jgi:uncharacterized protein DUF4184
MTSTRSQCCGCFFRHLVSVIFGHPVPFTLAHPAAAVPFRRCGLVLSALVVGSVVSDFEYFIRLEPHGRLGHTMPGIVLITFPGAFAALWIFHACMKRGLAALLPLSTQRRLQPYLQGFRFAGGRRVALIAMSIAVGIATHLVWDSFTHQDTIVYQHWMWLHSIIELPVLERPMPVYRMLHLLSSVLGCLVLAFWTWLWWVQAPEWPTPLRAELSAGRRAGIAALMLAVPVVCAVLRTATTSNNSPFQLTGIAVITAISAFVAEALILGVVWELTHRRRTISG